MTLFWSLAALMVLLGLALFLPALFGRARRTTTGRQDLNLLIHQQRRQELTSEAIEAEQAEAIRVELDRALLNDLDTAPTTATRKPPFAGRTALIAGLIAAVALGIALYGQLGRIDLLHFPPVAATATPDDIQATIEQLASRLAKDPDDLEGWLLLGRSLQATQNPQKALTAYEFAGKLAPDNLDITALYAQALAEANEGSMQGQPSQLVDNILQRDPNHQTALWLAGLAAAERRDVSQAVTFWQKLQSQLPPASDDYRAVAEYITRVQALSPAVAGEPKATAAQPASGARIKVQVSLAAVLRSRASPEDSVFIFARAAEGPPMPLAVVRRQVKDLPLTVTLDDSMAMMASRKLSSFDRIVIGARVSKSGKPTSSSGDLQGLSGSLPSRTTDTQSIEIREVVP